MNKCLLCKEVEVKELEPCCSECINKIFKLIEDEEKRIIQKPKYLNAVYGTISILKYLEFGFSLGLDNNRNINFNGNCSKWSNAFMCEPLIFQPVWNIIEYHNVFNDKQKLEIEHLLRDNPNKLFFCKDRDKQVLEWHYYPSKDYRNDHIILYQEDLIELKNKMNEVK